jgi:hypothetical protein
MGQPGDEESPILVRDDAEQAAVDHPIEVAIVRRVLRGVHPCGTRHHGLTPPGIERRPSRRIVSNTLADSVRVPRHGERTRNSLGRASLAR